MIKFLQKWASPVIEFLLRKVMTRTLFVWLMYEASTVEGMTVQFYFLVAMWIFAICEFWCWMINIQYRCYELTKGDKNAD